MSDKQMRVIGSKTIMVDGVWYRPGDLFSVRPIIADLLFTRKTAEYIKSERKKSDFAKNAQPVPRDFTPDDSGAAG